MVKHNSINDIPQSEAESKTERLLLGFLKKEAGRIGFGQITIEVTVRDGRLDRIKSKEISSTLNIGCRDA